MYERPMDMDNKVGIDCGNGGGQGRGDQRENYDNYNWTTIKK